MSVDARVELLSALLDTSEWPDYGASWTREDIAYRRALRRKFRPFKSHAAVRLLNELQRKGFVFDAPVSFIVHLSPLPELAQVVPWDPELAARAGGAANLDKLRLALKSFAADTRFERFFARHRPFYDELIASARRVSPGDEAVALLERHYGARQAAYSILLAPMFGRGNFGVTRPEAGSQHLYFIGGAAEWKGDVAQYASWSWPVIRPRRRSSWTRT
jgi:hypothetical protein